MVSQSVIVLLVSALIATTQARNGNQGRWSGQVMLSGQVQLHTEQYQSAPNEAKFVAFEKALEDPDEVRRIVNPSSDQELVLKDTLEALFEGIDMGESASRETFIKALGKQIVTVIRSEHQRIITAGGGSDQIIAQREQVMKRIRGQLQQATAKTPGFWKSESPWTSESASRKVKEVMVEISDEEVEQVLSEASAAETRLRFDPFVKSLHEKAPEVLGDTTDARMKEFQNNILGYLKDLYSQNLAGSDPQASPFLKRLAYLIRVSLKAGKTPEEISQVLQDNELRIARKLFTNSHSETGVADRIFTDALSITLDDAL